jgi:alkylation response protein AidB-like acyl-CoA dehydrogenase
VREVASADSSLAHLYAYHHLGMVTPHLAGTVDQRERWYALTARDNLF